MEAKVGPDAHATARTADPGGHPRLDDLIPIAVVIAAGCEPCARRTVERALAQGSSPQDVRRAVGIVSHLSRQDCFAQAVGPQVVHRMQKPLAMASATLAGAKRPALSVER